MINIVGENKVVKIDLVKANDFNPKDFSDENSKFRETIEKLKKSITAHGQAKAVNVREIKGGFEIIDGYHTHLAMNELKAKEIEVKNHGKISRKKAIGICLSMENIKNPIDEIEQANLIKSLHEIDKISLEEISEITPFEIEELQSKIDLSNFELPTFDKKEETEEDIVMNTKLVVNFDTEDQKTEFLNKMKKERKSREISEGEYLINLIK